MKSLRLRIVGFTLLAVGLVWLATAFIVWNQTHHELDELMSSLPATVRADLEHEHNDLIEEIAEHLAAPLLIAFPLLALLLVLAVTLALRPLRQLADDVAARAPEHLEPLPTHGALSEVRPLIERLNHLFADIGRALENERRFTADAAHELRTPLAALKTQAQVAQGANDTDTQAHALRQIVLGCDRATHLVEQLLTLARLDAPRQNAFVPVDLYSVASEILSACAGAAVQRGSTLALTGEPGICTIQGDPVLLQVLLRNLVDNAIRHTPPGTEISVGIDVSEQHIRLWVHDNGPGITSGEAQNLMQRFHRAADALGEGSGLGLSIVQRIAELHGTVFTLGPRVGIGGTAATLEFTRSA